METAYDGRQVVGMDLHRRRSVLVRMTEDGRRLGVARITNSPAELCRVIAQAGESPRVVLEGTYGGVVRAATTADRRPVPRTARVIGVITHVPDCDMLSLLWAWRSGANPLVRQPLRHVSGPLRAGEGPSCRGA
jgi:hypothetical protein